MRGPSGCGKTTLIRELGLENNSLEIDKIKVMISGCEIYEDKLIPTRKDSYKVFDELNSILRKRMEYGLLTVIDNNNLIETHIDRYQKLCNEYGYECVVVNFKIKYDEVLKRNSERTDKLIDEQSLKKEFSEYINQKIPRECKIIKPEDMYKELNFKFDDVSRFEKIVHIGDIHGHNQLLLEALQDVNFKTLYVLIGDYIDRGPESVETLKTLIKIKRKPNVVLLKGNHEVNLIKYVNGETIFGKSFEDTYDELKKSDIDMVDLKDLCRCLKNYYSYNYKGKKVFCCHGGVSSLKNLETVNESCFVNGSGKDDTDVDREFFENEKDLIQIHGHRNPYNISINKYPNSFNLEGDIENTLELRTIEIDKKLNFNPKTIILN